MQDEAADPADVGFLGADAVMAYAQCLSNLIEQARRLGREVCSGGGDRVVGARALKSRKCLAPPSRATHGAKIMRK